MHHNVTEDGDMPAVLLLIADPDLAEITSTIIGLGGICVRRDKREGQESVPLVPQHDEVVVTTLSAIIKAKATHRTRRVVVDDYLFNDPASVGIRGRTRLDGTRLLQDILICHRRGQRS